MKTIEKELKIRVSVSYAKGNEVIKMLDEKETEFLPLKVVPHYNETLNKWEFFVDTDEKANGIGTLSDSDEVADILRDSIDAGYPLEVKLSNHDGKLIKGIVSTEIPEIKKVKIADGEELETVKKRIVDEGILEKERLEDNICIMRSHRCPEELIRQVLLTYRKYDAPICDPKTIFVDPDVGAKTSSIISEALLNAIIGSPIIFEGDKSVGKNVCAETVARLLNKPYYLLTMTRSMTADDIFGTKTTDNEAANMLTPELAKAYLLWKDNIERDNNLEKAIEFEIAKAKAASVSIVQEISPFVKWLKTGGVMCFNEMNMAEANFFASFANQITDGSGFIDVPGVGRIDINSNCTLIGTQNAEYTGVCDQNDATMSRFGCISFEYPASIKAQLKAATKNIGLDDQYYSQTDKFYKTLLQSVRRGDIENSCLNIRGCVRALTAVAKVPGLTTLKKELEIHVIGTCPIDDRPPLMGQLNELVSL